MMTLQDFLSGWPLLWPSPGHQCQAPHSPAQLDKQTPKKPLGAEDTNSWEMLGKKLLLCLRGWCLILEPLNHPSVAQGTSPPWHLSWGGVESPPWRTFLHRHKHGRVWRNPWKPPRHWEHWSCTRGPCLSSWLALCCCRHIWLFGLVRGCPYVRIILSLQGYSTRELCNPFVWTVAWEATTGQNQMTWGCFFPWGTGGRREVSSAQRDQGFAERQVQDTVPVLWGGFVSLELLEASAWPGHPEKLPLSWGDALCFLLLSWLAAASQPAPPVWEGVWSGWERGWAPTGLLPSPASEQVTSAGPAPSALECGRLEQGEPRGTVGWWELGVVWSNRIL